MGKGFNNYMCKKFFHPASRDNLKRVWMAEQKADSYKKKQEELRQQYEKEQDLYTNKAILSKDSKDKLSVNFMYEPPPGTKKDREREDDEPEYKFEWQRKFNAPREDYCKGDEEIRDQPFGILVRNVRCIKCHKWGHINTDKECPMYCRSITTEQDGTSFDPMTLVQQMRDDGLAMKRSAYATQQLTQFTANQTLLESSDEEEKSIEESEADFLKSLSREQKHKLLKKLKKLEKKGNKQDIKKSKKKKKSKVKEEICSGEDDDYAEQEKGKKPRIKKEYVDEDEEHKEQAYKDQAHKDQAYKDQVKGSKQPEDRHRNFSEHRSRQVESRHTETSHRKHGYKEKSTRGYERYSRHEDRPSRR